jgi:hypothetical protein
MVRCVLLLAVCLLASTAGSRAQDASSGIDAALCRLIDAAATAQNVPTAFLTRLIFQESSFRPSVVSPAGAQGVAQFMPGTARERGLADPFDPEQAMPKAAHFLAEMKLRFGNWGLAAAGYNGGPNRVPGFVAGTSALPYETETYVLAITGRPAEAWAEAARAAARGIEGPPLPATAKPEAPCLETVADIRAGRPVPTLAEAPFAPWGVQLAGNFSKARALASFRRAAARQSAVIGELAPMVIGTRLRSRGTRAFYRVRLPAATRADASILCGRIQRNGGACIVLRS